jgi:biotin carboxylase
VNIVVCYDRGAAAATEIIDSLRALGRILFVVAESDHTRALAPLLRDLVEMVPASDPEHSAGEILRHFTPDAVVTYSERMLRFTSRLATRLGVASHSAATVELLTDKVAQRRRLTESTVDGVRFGVLDDPTRWPEAAAEVGFPAVVKPITGEGSRDVHLLRDMAEAAATLPGLLRDRPAKFLLEEFLAGTGALTPFGDYVSVESVVSNGTVRHLAVTGKFPLAPPFRECGQFWPSTLDSDGLGRVGTLAERAIRALGVEVGLTHTEIKLTAGGPRIIEVNGRLGGWMNDLALRSGSGDLIRLAALAATGDLGPEPATPTKTYFQYSNPSPLAHSRLARVEGSPSARSVPGIVGYRNLVRAGTTVGGGVGTAELDILFGESPTHDDMIRTISAALAQLRFHFDVNGHTHIWQPHTLGAVPPL